MNVPSGEEAAAGRAADGRVLGSRAVRAAGWSGVERVRGTRITTRRRHDRSHGASCARPAARARWGGNVRDGQTGATGAYWPRRNHHGQDGMTGKAGATGKAGGKAGATGAARVCLVPLLGIEDTHGVRSSHGGALILEESPELRHMVEAAQHDILIVGEQEYDVGELCARYWCGGEQKKHHEALHPASVRREGRRPKNQETPMKPSFVEVPNGPYFLCFISNSTTTARWEVRVVCLDGIRERNTVA